VTTYLPEEASPELLLELGRYHWSIKNGQYYGRDRTQDEDRCLVRDTTSAHNLPLRNKPWRQSASGGAGILSADLRVLPRAPPVGSKEGGRLVMAAFWARWRTCRRIYWLLADLTPLATEATLSLAVGQNRVCFVFDLT
jgi:hypothetical protein